MQVSPYKTFAVQRATQESSSNTQLQKYYIILHRFTVNHKSTHRKFPRPNVTSGLRERCRLPTAARTHRQTGVRQNIRCECQVNRSGGVCLNLGFLVLDRQVEFKLCWKLILRVQSV